MGAFKSAVITAKGQALLAKAVMNTADLEFTKISVSETKLTGDLANLTGIGTVKQSVKVASVKRVNNSSIKVSASITNETLTSGYYIRNIGLYAKDPDEGEILYSISIADESSATADWMPPFNGVGVSSLMIDLLTVVSNADKVVVEVDPTASATVAQIMDLQTQIDIHYEELTPSKVVGGEVVAIQDSAELPFIGLKVFGKTEQAVTTGKNLLANNAESKTINGITFVVNEDGSVTANGTATDVTPLVINTAFRFEAGVSYILTGCPSNGSNTSYQMDIDDGKDAVDIGSGVTISYDEDTEVNVRIRIASGVTVSLATFYPMIRLATIEDATYERYTGGKPAPSIGYPQEIKSAGDADGIDISVHSKNLFNCSAVTGTVSGITFTVNEDGSVGISGTSTERSSYTLGTVYLPAGTYVMDQGVVLTDNEASIFAQYTINGITSYIDLRKNATGKKEFTLNAPAMVLVRADVRIAGVTISGVTLYPNIRLASITDITHEQGKEVQTLTFSTPNGLPAIPVTDASLATYTDENGQMWCADEIDFERGVYIQRVYRYVIQSADITNVDNSNASAGGTIAGIVLPKPYYTIPNPNTVCVMSDRATGVSYHNRGKAVGVYRIYASETSRASVTFRYPNSVGAITLEQAKADIVGSTIQYILEDPIETALALQEITAYKALHSNYPNTTVLSSVNAYISAEYVKGAYNRVVGSVLNRASERLVNTYRFNSGGFNLNLTFTRFGNIVEMCVNLETLSSEQSFQLLVNFNDFNTIFNLPTILCIPVVTATDDTPRHLKLRYLNDDRSLLEVQCMGDALTKDVLYTGRITYIC